MIGDDDLRIMIAGGGTAGHINPGIAIAKEIQKNHLKAKIIFIGTKKGLEKDLVPKEGFDIKLIDVKGFKRKVSIDTIISIKELIKGMYQSRKIIKEYQPDIVIGTGGYVCGPVLLNASFMGIPTAIHEQNALPGMTNKILSRFVDTVMISFEESKKYFKSKNVYLTGNPIRQEIIDSDREESRKKLKIGLNEKLVVAFGGSIGAEKINNAMIDFIKAGISVNVKIIFGTGEREYEKVLSGLEKSQYDKDRITILPYIYNMNEVMSAADLIICRSGAITLSEITVLGVPAVLIPSPNVTNNHQEFNARALEKGGAALVLLEKDIDSKGFKDSIENILNDDIRLKEISKNSKEMGKADATKKIYEILIKRIKNQ